MKTRLFPLFKSSVCSPSVLAASIAALVGSHSAQANTTNNFFQNSAMVTATNYSTGALPTATDDVVLTTVSLTPSINASTAIVFGSLDVLNGSAYTIANNSSVTNSTFKLGSATLANAQIGAAAADLIYLSNNSNLTITGTNTAATPRTLGLVLGGSGNFNVNSGSTLNISAAITGAFVLTKTGVGALTLGGTVNPSAGLVINDGTVTMTLNNATSQALLTVNSPGILNFNNGQIFGVLNGNGTINENGNFLYTILPRIMICDLGRTGNSMLTGF
mgnify:CR=1 FL=1